MNPTLNSPKYADPKSLAFQMHKIQQERKNRKKFVPQLEQRYFRRNEGTTDYATIPEVTLTGDFVIELEALVGSEQPFRTFISSAARNIELRVDASGTKFEIVGSIGALYFVNGAPIVSGSTLVPMNEFFKITISRSTAGASTSINSLWSRGSDFANNLKGILANLKIWDNGTLIRDYPLNDNSSTIRDLANGQDGTIINGNADDWGLFDKQANGDWLGQELVVNGGFDSGSGWIKEAKWAISEGVAIASAGPQGLLYQSIDRPSIYNVSGDITTISSGQLEAYNGNNYQTIASSIGHFSSEIVNANEAYAFFTLKANSSTELSLDNISVKEVLKNA